MLDKEIKRSEKYRRAVIKEMDEILKEFDKNYRKLWRSL
jgi:hypothetical protein